LSDKAVDDEVLTLAADSQKTQPRMREASLIEELIDQLEFRFPFQCDSDFYSA
jgi:hypothetical protein